MGDLNRGGTTTSVLRPPDLATYREGVADLLLDLAGHAAGVGGVEKAERIVTDRLQESQFTTVLAATPRGVSGVTHRLVLDVRAFRPNSRSSAADLSALVRIHLLAQIDALWWGHVPPYRTDDDLNGSADLVSLDTLPALPFRYRRQPTTKLARVSRAVQRRLLPDRTPRTAGLRFTRARREAIALLERLALAFAATAPPGTPPLWVTSLARSLEHQTHLRALGYTAMVPSAHCVGYATDIEMSWYRRFGAQAALETVLLECQAAGDVNVIDEGQAWHVCISPAAVPGLRRAFVATRGA
jgi:hypothetical protein